MRAIVLALAIACGAPGTAPLLAQPWVPPPPPDSNAARAYRHFLNSPYSYRTYSGRIPGYGAEWEIPYGYQGFSTDPGYVHERITPHGYERLYLVPGRETYTVTPFGGDVLYIPGYAYRSYSPFVP